MIDRPRRTFRPTPTFLAWVLADVVGVLVLVLGAVYFLHGPGFLGMRFPSSTMEAAVATILGLGLVFVAAIKMIVEVLKQAPRDGDAARRS